MKVDITDLRKTSGAKDTFEYEGPLDLGDVRFVGPVKLDLHLDNAVSRILVRGTLEGRVKATCSRCAEEFETPLSVEIDEEFLPESSPEIESQGDLTWSTVNVYPDESNDLVVDEVLRQNALAAIPIQQICDEDCKGLCSECGQNLNVRACGCEPAIDPRWAGLQELKARLGSNGQD